MQLQPGRPADCTGRSIVEVRTYDLLDNLHIPYSRLDHEAAMTMEACAAIDGALGTVMCKNLLLCNRQCTAFYLLMLPGAKVFKTKDLSAQIGSSRLSFASGEYMQQLLDICPGSLSVLGLMNDRDNRVQLLIDEELLSAPSIGVHPCVNTSSLNLSMSDLINIFLPAVNHSWVTVTLPRQNS